MTVEINGVQHLRQRQKEIDDIRRSRLGISGRLVVDVGSYTVRHNIELAVLLTADALFSRGWGAVDIRDGLLRLAAATAASRGRAPSPRDQLAELRHGTRVAAPPAGRLGGVPARAVKGPSPRSRRKNAEPRRTPATPHRRDALGH